MYVNPDRENNKLHLYRHSDGAICHLDQLEREGGGYYFE
jgi:hypothetical protein